MPETSDNPTERDRLEEALASALAAHESGGAAALEQYLVQNASDAPRLREALADLNQIDLLSVPRTDIPTQLGEFRILQQIGSGGMGVVYLAEQASLGREVALKVVRPELLFFDGARERFRREIDAVAKLEHPAIVPILATGIADGIPYYAMPRIRGRSAEAVVKQLAGHAPDTLTGTDLRRALIDPLDTEATDTDSTFSGSWWRAVVQLVRKAALGIHHAHTRGILHRDLKPSNLMLTADGRAIVLDFGLAQARGDQSLTRTGSAPGSPAYMAPEQVRGEPADERTDVYGLGALLHCLVALRPPFDVAAPEALRSQILAGARQDLRAHTSIPTELRLVLDTAMDVEPVRRYASANALAEDLQAVLEGRAILARALPIPVRLRRLAARHRVLATATAASLVFLVVLPTVLLWQQHKDNVALSAQVQRSNQSVKVSVDAVEKLLGHLASNQLRNLPSMHQVAAKMLRDALSLFDELASDKEQADRVERLRMLALGRLAELEAVLGDVAAATADLRRALELLQEDRLLPPGRYLRGRLRRQLATYLVEQNQLDLVPALIDGACNDLMLLAEHPDLRAHAALEIGLCEGVRARLAANNGDDAAAERALRAAIKGICDAGPEEAIAHCVAVLNLVRFLKQEKNYDDALQLTDQVLATTNIPSTPEGGWPVSRMIVAMALHERAEILRRLQRSDESIATAQLALDACDEVLRDYPDEPSARRMRGGTANNLALIYTERNEWAAARPLVEDACQDQLAVLAKNPNDEEAQRFLVSHRLTLAACLRELNAFEELEDVARALAKMPGNPSLPLNSARNLLRCAAAAAAPTKAAALRAEALDLLVEAHRRNLLVNMDDPLYEPLLEDPRFLKIATHKPGG
ncbi:MAG: serine/threonine-protein kinase [Planctomycetota bacterium]